MREVGKLKVLKNCAQCGDIFEPRYKQSIYCSTSCYNKASNAKYIKRRREKREAVERMSGAFRAVICKAWG